MKNSGRFLLLLTCLISVAVQAQLPLGEWRDHFPWRTTHAMATGDNQAWAASDLGIIRYDLEDQSIERITKNNRLSDVGITSINYSDFASTLVVGYRNGNLDLLKGDVTINMADIKRSSIIGDKGINHIYFKDQFAYLSTGFGIVVVDLVREEVKETYIIGPNESQIQVNAVTTDNSYIWAATETEGLYRADINDPNLANFNNWSQVQDIPNPNGPFNQVVAFDNKVWVNLAGGEEHDTLYSYDGAIWTQETYFTSLYNQHLTVSDGLLVIPHLYNVHVMKPGGSTPLVAADEQINVFSSDVQTFTILDARYFQGQVWIADQARGMVKALNSWGATEIRPDGPRNAAAWQMEVYRSQLWVVSGALLNAWTPSFSIQGMYHFDNEEWTNINQWTTSNLDTVSTLVALAVDPADEGHVFVGSWINGLFEFRDGVVVNAWNEQNSSIQTDPAWGGSKRYGIGGVAFDSESNIWISNTGASEPVSVKTAGGAWQSFGFNGAINGKSVYGMLVDNSDQIWFINKDAGLVVLNTAGTPTNTNDDDFKHLLNTTGNGNLPSNTVNCMTEDIDGEIWVGTNEGIAVFYAPENMFEGGDFDAQQILIEQDGNIQILFETEIINAITIDGANQKWVGTRGAGVFLISEDGTEQIHAFNTDNSPLISNNINDIAINHETGEVFFATDLGIQGFRGTATGFTDDYQDVFAYPNPVRPDYTGPIAIKGLLQNTNVKITDVAGNLVYETTSEGGTAVWYGTNFSGERVSTGVYLVFLSDSQGEKTMITKILVAN